MGIGCVLIEPQLPPPTKNRITLRKRFFAPPRSHNHNMPAPQFPLACEHCDYICTASERCNHYWTSVTSATTLTNRSAAMTETMPSSTTTITAKRPTSIVDLTLDSDDEKENIPPSTQPRQKISLFDQNQIRDIWNRSPTDLMIERRNRRKCQVSPSPEEDSVNLDHFVVKTSEFSSRILKSATPGMLNHLLTLLTDWEPHSGLAESFIKMEAFITTATWTLADLSNSKTAISFVSEDRQALNALEEVIAIYSSFGERLIMLGTMPEKMATSWQRTALDLLLSKAKAKERQSGHTASMLQTRTTFMRVSRKLIRLLFASPHSPLSIAPSGYFVYANRRPMEELTDSASSGEPSQMSRNGYCGLYQTGRTGLDASPPTSPYRRKRSYDRVSQDISSEVDDLP